MYLAKSVIEKIRPYIEKSETADDCILYPRKGGSGYGEFNATLEGGFRKHYSMHRVAYQVYYNDDISSDDVICHKCDTPLCVNPKHLFKGTHADNVADRDAKGRSAKGPHNGRYRDGHYTKEAKQFRRDHPELRRHAGNYSAERAVAIRRLWDEGLSQKRIADTIGVHRTTVYRAVNYRSYRDIA